MERLLEQDNDDTEYAMFDAAAKPGRPGKPASAAANGDMMVGRLLPVLTLVVAIIALIVASVAVHKADHEHSDSCSSSAAAAGTPQQQNCWCGVTQSDLLPLKMEGEYLRMMYYWQNGMEANFKANADADIFFQIPRLTEIGAAVMATGITGVDNVWTFRQNVPGVYIGNKPLTWLNTFDTCTPLQDSSEPIGWLLKCQMKIYLYTGQLYMIGAWTLRFNQNVQLSSFVQHIEWASYLNNTAYITVNHCNGYTPCPPFITTL